MHSFSADFLFGAFMPNHPDEKAVNGCSFLSFCNTSFFTKKFPPREAQEVWAGLVVSEMD